MLQIRDFRQNGYYMLNDKRHDIQKLTREQLKNLASECAHMVINMINLDNVDYSKLLCTQEYTTFLIINTTFNYLKRLSDKTVNDLSE